MGYNRGRPKTSMTMIEVLVVIVLIALLIILLLTRVSGILDRQIWIKHGA